MPSALAIIGFATVAAIGAAGMYEADRLPPIGFTVPIPIWRPHVGLPPSLAVQRDNWRAAAASAGKALDQCHLNAAALAGAVAAQNAGADAVKREADARMAVSARAAQSARAVAESYRRAATDVLGASRGSQDACAAADALILKEASR